MNNVASVLQRKNVPPVVLKPDNTVAEALQVMSDKNIGSIIVMDNGKYLGIMTERDYSRKVILKGKNSTDTKISEIMSTGLPAVRPEDSIERCMQLMSDVVKETILAQKETINQLENYIHSNV
jgi:CBS domain-containing protein